MHAAKAVSSSESKRSFVRDFLYDYVKSRQLTMLGVGPMSRNCVDAAIELANRYAVPLKLIASRRQIECAAMGGGYVENWSTEEFAAYVRARDRGGRIILARDHGGPWQHPVEGPMSLGEAMASAKRSYEADILAGFQVIHIDPSIDPSGAPSMDVLLERVFELLGHCQSVAQDAGRDVAFEVGTEEQGAGLHSASEFDELLRRILSGCEARGLQKPLFVVSQTGTKVMERRNIGRFEDLVRGGSRLNQLRELVGICERHGVLMKEHNTDYLSERALALHPMLGIHAANVAPEFGVVETLALLRLAEETGQSRIADRFLEIAHASRKWEKWMLPGTRADDRECAIICGHYVFANPEARELKTRLSFALKSRNLDVDDYLKRAVASAMLKYFANFGLMAAAMAERERAA